jgi:hypothetical protein
MNTKPGPVIELPKQKRSLGLKLQRAKLMASVWLKFKVLFPIRLAWYWLQFKCGKRRVPMRLRRHPLLRGRNDPCWCGMIDPKRGKVFKYKRCHWEADRRAGF